MNNKVNFLYAVIIALLILNFGTLGYMFYRAAPHNPEGPKAVSEWLQGQLNLNSGQQIQFEKLQEEHRRKMDAIHQQDRDLHDRYFDLLKGDTTDSIQLQLLADSIALNRKQTELATFYAFKKIRAICNPEQQTKFDAIVGEALRMMGPRPHSR